MMTIEMPVKPIPEKLDKGRVAIDREMCKGCGLCVEACALRVLALSPELNRFGYHPAFYKGNGCNGCNGNANAEHVMETGWKTSAQYVGNRKKGQQVK